MIPANQQELITAAVDGELSATEVRAFRRLLDNSAEARALYAKLKADRARVRSLPQAAPPADLRAKILARIASATPAPVAKAIRLAPKSPAQPEPSAQPLSEPATSPGRRLPAWVPVAVAASLLLCITAGSYAFFNAQTSEKNRLAKHPWSNVLPAPQELPNVVPSPTAPQPERRPDPTAVVRVDVSPVPPLAPRLVASEAIPVAPEPRPAYHDLIASPVLPNLPPFDFVQLRVPFLRAVTELEREDIRQELTDELGRDPGSPFRLDLFVRDTARGVEVFQNAAKVAGMTVFADAATLEKLKKKQVASVVIFSESLTPAELTDLFVKVCAEDTKFSPRVCDSLHATSVVRTDEAELRLILGLDTGLFKRPRTGNTGNTGMGSGGDKSPLDKSPLDKNGEPKSVSAGTIDSVTKALTTPPAKASEKPAVLMAWQATPGVARTIPSQSAELKQYLAKRGDRKPTAVPAIIVIRPVG